MHSQTQVAAESRTSAEVGGLALLFIAVAFGAVTLWPELRIGALPPNDSILHRALSERMAAHFTADEPFLNPWVSESSLGYPVWQSYQPLPHLIGAAWLRLASPFTDGAHAFAALQYLLLVLFPVSVYAGARLLGLAPIPAGLASVLVLTPTSAGDLGRYGLSYGATTWRGSGLYSQLVALHFLCWSLGLTRRALDRRAYLPLAALGLALTALSHIIFGYVAFVSAAVLAAAGPKGEREAHIARLVSIVLPAMFLLMWFIVPLWLGRYEVNHSRWEDAVKWDSYGAPFLLREIASGRFFDASRPPFLSALVVVGWIGVLIERREVTTVRLVALTLVWLVLFFGRETWGHLVLLAGVPADLHMHRLQAAFELSALLLAARGIFSCWIKLRGVSRHIALGFAAVIGALVLGLLHDRAGYLSQNAEWGQETLVAYAGQRESVDAALEDIDSILDARPGRVSAGKAAEWGNQFKVGAVPVYAFLARRHIDQVSFLYHSMSLTSDLMVHRVENDFAHAVAFGVRAVLAPAGRELPQPFRRKATHGRFVVWEASPEGYFGLVDVGARYTGPRRSFYEASKAWMDSSLLRAGVVAVLGDGGPRNVPEFGRWQPLPPVDPALVRTRGHILGEQYAAGRWSAKVDSQRSTWVFLKVTYDPHLVASVDGTRVETLRVTPGFLAFPVERGLHEVNVSWEPGHLRVVLLVGGVIAFVWYCVRWRRGTRERREETWAAKLSAILQPFSTPRSRAALCVPLLAVIAFHPLLRGRLVQGHDATEYPPRLVEFGRAIADGHIPPVWAADLGAGRGQPLFGFAPPLVYSAALPFHWLGLRLADSLQFGLFLLHLLGASAMYRVARLLRAPRDVAVGVAAAWMFAPYTALDLFVRAAYAESAAVAVSPLALFGLLCALRRPAASTVAFASACIALVPLAHNAIALLLFPALALIVAVQAVTRASGQRIRVAFAGVASLFGALGLSAFFWLPALAENGFVRTDLLRVEFLHWSQHAVAVWQLFWSRWGYGLSGPGTGDGMSFRVGLAHLALAATGCWLWLRTGRRSLQGLAVGFAICALGGMFLATNLSGFLWERIPPLQYLAYPWRALCLPGLFLPLLALPALAALRPRWRKAVVACLILINLPHTEPHGYLTYDEEFYAPESIAQRGLATTTREEYRPRWVKETPGYTDHRLSGVDGPIRVQLLEHRTGLERFSVGSDQPAQVETASFWYPGFEVTVNGKATMVQPHPQHGTMLFDVPSGRSEVDIRYIGTTVRRITSWLSLVVAVLLVTAGWVVPVASRNRQIGTASGVLRLLRMR